jgi:hypothetical protein
VFRDGNPANHRLERASCGGRSAGPLAGDRITRVGYDSFPIALRGSQVQIAP